MTTTKIVPWNKGRTGVYSKETLEKFRKARLGKRIPFSQRWKHGRKGAESGNWKGGRTKRKDGYILVYCPNHPYGKHKYIFEHRLMMEKHLGKILESNEVVHHINGNRSDNRIKNLKVLTPKQHNKTHPLPKRGKLIKCNSCQKEIYLPQYRLKYSQKHFCSYKCMGKGKEDKMGFICPTCKKGFFRTSSQVKANTKGVLYCSHICWYKRG